MKNHGVVDFSSQEEYEDFCKEYVLDKESPWSKAAYEFFCFGFYKGYQSCINDRYSDL